MNEQEFYILKNIEKQILELSSKADILSTQIAIRNNKMLQQNMYVNKLENRLMEKGGNFMDENKIDITDLGELPKVVTDFHNMIWGLDEPSILPYICKQGTEEVNNEG